MADDAPIQDLIGLAACFKSLDPDDLATVRAALEKAKVPTPQSVRDVEAALRRAGAFVIDSDRRASEDFFALAEMLRRAS
jgi:hypothetical protein